MIFRNMEMELILEDFFNKQISAIAIAPALEITKSEAL